VIVPASGTTTEYQTSFPLVAKPNAPQDGSGSETFEVAPKLVVVNA